MTDPLEIVWNVMDAPNPLFTAEAVRAWPDSFMERLTGAGLLVRTNNASHVVCPNCSDGHVEEVVARERPPGTVRFFIRCPEALRVEVPPESLLQWTVDFDAVARAVAAGMNVSGTCTALVPARLWRLGKVSWQGVSREVLLARALAGPDGVDIAGRISTGGRPIVFVADLAPPLAIWPGRIPAVIPLSRVASMGATGLDLDAAQMMMLVKDADAAAEASEALPLDPKKKRLFARKQLKAELNAHLEDDVLLAAYKQDPSYRRVADQLTEQLGRKITKDKVKRAVDRAGGIKAVLRGGDSQSVRCTVASHRRDNGKRIFQQPKPPDSE